MLPAFINEKGGQNAGELCLPNSEPHSNRGHRESVRGWPPAGYGKFVKSDVPQWPSKVGMSIIYLLPSLTSVLGLLFLISTAAPTESAVGGGLQQLWQLAATHRGILIAAMLSVHFIKRELEVSLSPHVLQLHCSWSTRSSSRGSLRLA